MKPFYSKLLIILLLTSLLIPILAKADIEIPNPLKAQNFIELLNTIIDFIFILSLGIAPIMIIISGFYFITAMGEPEKIATAKKIIIWALIGLLVVFCAKGLIELFQKVFEVRTGP